LKLIILSASWALFFDRLGLSLDLAILPIFFVKGLKSVFG
jgi:hypothetical protein